MAVKEINAILNANYPVLATTQLHAGMVVARDANTGNATYNTVVAADRSLHGQGAYLGVLADDTARTGNTIIAVDPVGSCYLDASNNFQANNNGEFSAAKRALGDYQDEAITNVTNLTAGASGFQGPARGVGVYTTASDNLETDQFALYQTGDSGSSTYLDVAFSGGQTYLVNDLLTYGYGANAGLYVKAIVGSTNLGRIVARVDSYNASTNKLAITLL